MKPTKKPEKLLVLQRDTIATLRPLDTAELEQVAGGTRKTTQVGLPTKV